MLTTNRGEENGIQLEIPSLIPHNYWQKLNKLCRVRDPRTFQPHVSYESMETPMLLISFPKCINESMNICPLPHLTKQTLSHQCLKKKFSYRRGLFKVLW